MSREIYKQKSHLINSRRISNVDKIVCNDMKMHISINKCSIVNAKFCIHIYESLRFRISESLKTSKRHPKDK